VSESVEGEERLHLRREAATMALYVALCLLAVLVARQDTEASTIEGLEVVWGTTLGLAIVHWFAFRYSARLFGGGSVTDLDVRIAQAQLAAASAIGAVASVPIILFPASVEFAAAWIVISVVVAVVGYLVAEIAGASKLRSLAYAGVVLSLATAIAVTKNLLAAH
jgi:hypothetical protein